MKKTEQEILIDDILKLIQERQPEFMDTVGWGSSITLCEDIIKLIKQ